MKLVILAAGQGTRLRPITDDKPKAMVEYLGKTMLQHIIDTAQECGMGDISAVVGYHKEHIKKQLSTTFFNPLFDSTNMVYSLSFAKDHMINDDMIVSYGDIIYSSNVLSQLIVSENADITLVSDKEWEKLWMIRMEDIYSDVESFCVNNERVTELGKKTSDKSKIQGQYIGLFKVHKHKIQDFFDIYQELKNTLPEKEWKNMYMTSYLQYLIEIGWNINPLWIFGEWLEIDSTENLEAYTKNNYTILRDKHETL